MHIDECTLPKSNALVTDYMKGDDKVATFFEYDYKDMQTYKKRIQDLAKQDFPRKALSEHLASFNQQFTQERKVFANIEKLSSTNSAVVITGQQAGFLTGPLYTIYKAISTIEHAKELEAKLNIPVAPIFWVAGEDHDFQEINHVWVVEENEVVKSKYPVDQHDKCPVSKIKIKHKHMERWIEEVFATFGETAYSKQLFQSLKEKMHKSKTISEFFIHTMAALFAKHGLVFIDSNNEHLRKIEAPFFKKLIHSNEALRQALQEQEKKLLAQGYPSGLNIEENCAHLFYHVNDERELLYCKDRHHYQIKGQPITLTKDELEAICDKQPELLSNNVVTRPLMQEFLFPTLAFIGGPGEITYWAQLKPLFSLMERKMPPIVPRMHVTLIERKIYKSIEKFNLSLSDILMNGLRTYKENWLKEQTGDEAETILNKTRQEIDIAHERLRKYAWSLNDNLGQLAEKNRTYILEQIEFMERRIAAMFKERYARELMELSQIECSLTPNNGLQERVWNIFYFLNQYGPNLIDKLFLPHDIQQSKHHIVYL